MFQSVFVCHAFLYRVLFAFPALYPSAPVLFLHRDFLMDIVADAYCSILAARFEFVEC